MRGVGFSTSLGLGGLCHCTNVAVEHFLTSATKKNLKTSYIVKGPVIDEKTGYKDPIYVPAANNLSKPMHVLPLRQVSADWLDGMCPMMWLCHCKVPSAFVVPIIRIKTLTCSICPEFCLLA